MQLDDDLTLEKASKMVRQSEQVKQEQRDIREEKAKQVQLIKQETDWQGGERLPIGRPQRPHSPSQRPQSTTLKEECLYKMWESSSSWQDQLPS